MMLPFDLRGGAQSHTYVGTEHDALLAGTKSVKEIVREKCSLCVIEDRNFNHFVWMNRNLFVSFDRR